MHLAYWLFKVLYLPVLCWTAYGLWRELRRQENQRYRITTLPAAKDAPYKEYKIDPFE